MTQPVEIPFQTLLDALSDTDTPVHARFLYRLSDLVDTELEQLARVWDTLPVWRRRALMEDVEVMGEKDTLLSYEALAQFALGDSDAGVRLPAVRTLWEFETPSLVATLLKLMETDKDEEVRAAAAAGLGRFVYLGEVEDISAQKLHTIEEALLKVVRSSEPEPIKRRALEALGFSSRKEVPALIKTAYLSGDRAWMASALRAMGRSANERYSDMVVRKLEDEFPNIRAEAARAAGELEIGKARQQLIDLLEDPEWSVRSASIWSLSQIGGTGVRPTLERLFETSSDEEEADFLEEALDNLAFTEETALFDLLDISEDGDGVGDEVGDEVYDDFFEDEDDQV